MVFVELGIPKVAGCCRKDFNEEACQHLDPWEMGGLSYIKTNNNYCLQELVNLKASEQTCFASEQTNKQTKNPNQPNKNLDLSFSLETDIIGEPLFSEYRRYPSSEIVTQILHRFFIDLKVFFLMLSAPP